MRKLLLLNIFILIIFSSFNVIGATIEDSKLYYSFNNANLSGSIPLDLTTNGNDADSNTGQTGITPPNSVVGESFYYAGSNLTKVAGYSSTGNIDFWMGGKFKLNGTGNQNIFYNSQSNNFRVMSIVSGKLAFAVWNGPLSHALSAQNIHADTWYCAVGVYTASNQSQQLYINQTLNATLQSPSTITGGTGTLGIGASYSSTGNIVGYVDEFMYGEGTLNLSEVQRFCNSTVTFPFVTEINVSPTINSINITPTLAFSDDTLTCNYNVSDSEKNEINWYINNNLEDNDQFCYQEQSNESTACGGLDTGTYFATNTSLFTNYTVPNNTINAEWQVYTDAIVNYTIPESCLFKNNGILELNITITGAFTNEKNCFNGVSWENIDSESVGTVGNSGSITTNNIMFDGKYDTQGCTSSACRTIVTGNSIHEEGIFWNISNSTLSSDNFNVSNNITCELVATNVTSNLSTAQNSSVLTIGSLLTINSSSTFDTPTSCDYTLTPITASQAFNITGTPDGSIYVDNGTYNVTADCGINFSISVLPLTIQNATHTLNFTLLANNAFNITFRDADTGSLLVGTVINVNFNTFSGNNSFNGSTNTSFFNATLKMPDTYTITYEATGYQQGNYIFTLVNRTFNTLTLYLQNSSNSQLVLVTLNDRFGNPISGGIITKQRWDGSAWITEEIFETDNQGQNEPFYVISTVFYNHLIEVNNVIVFGSINGDEEKKLIFTEDVNEGITFTVNLEGTGRMLEFNNQFGLNIDLAYTNTSNTTGFFTLAFSDPNGQERTVNLTITKGGSKEFVDSSQTTTASGNIIISVNETSNNSVIYYASGFVDGQLIDSLVIRIGQNSRIDWGSTGYIFAFIAVAQVYFLFLASPAIALWMGSAVFVALAMSGIIFQDMAYGIFMILLVLTYLITSIRSKGGTNS